MNFTPVDDVFAMFARRWRWIAPLWGALIVFAAIGIERLPDVYQSTGKLFVRLGRENVTLDPTANLGQGSMSAVPQLRDQEINTVVETLRSRVLYERVVDVLGPETVLAGNPSMLDWLLPRSLRPRNEAVDRLARRSEAMAVRKSNLISIACEGPDPALAQREAQTLVDCFFDYHRSLNRTPGAGPFFARQAKLLGEQLAAKEAETLAIKNRMGVVSVAEQKRLLLARADALEQDWQTSEACVMETEAAIAVFRQQIASLPEQFTVERSEGHANSSADAMRDRLYTLEVQESELAARLTDDHFLLWQAREQLAQAREIQQTEHARRMRMKGARNRAFDQAETSLLAKEAELAAHRARAEAQRAELDTTKQEMLALNQAEAQLAQLERELELLRDDYGKYSQSLEQTRIDEALEAGRISNISVAEPPRLPHRALRPNRACGSAWPWCWRPAWRWPPAWCLMEKRGPRG